MSQSNHDDCWIRAADTPLNDRPVIIWTKRPWLPKGETPNLSRHLDTGGAWYDPKEREWYHSDGHVAKDVTHWTEMPGKPIL